MEVIWGIDLLGEKVRQAVDYSSFHLVQNLKRVFKRHRDHGDVLIRHLASGGLY